MDETTQDDCLWTFLDAALYHAHDEVSVRHYQHDILEKLQKNEYPLKRAVNQVLLATFRCTTRKSERYLRDFVHDASTQVGASFQQAFAAVLNAKSKVIASSFAAARLIILRMSCVLMDVAMNESKDAMPSYLSDVIAAQSLILEALLTDSMRHQAMAIKLMVTLLKKHAALVPSYVEAITNGPNELQQYQLWLVLRHVGPQEQEVQDQLLKTYTFWAFESKTRSFVALQAEDRRLQGLTADQFKKLVQPTMAKMLKKSPDSILESVITFLHAAPIDFGPYLQEIFLSVVTAKLRSQKEDVRQFTIALVKELVRSFQSADSITQLVTTVAAFLEGKNGLLAQFYMREAGFAAMIEAADVISTTKTSVLTQDEIQSIASTAIAALMKAVEKEAHDATRHLGLLAMGKWIALAHQLPSDLVTKIKSGLQNKSEAIVAGYLRALAIMATDARSVDLACFVDDLVKIVNEATKKPNVLHLDGVLALSVAGAMACANSQVDAALAKHQIADLLLNASSFVAHSVKTLMHHQTNSTGDSVIAMGYAKPETTALTALPRALVWVLSSKQDDPSHAYKLLVDILTCNERSARSSAEEAIQGLYASSLDHCHGLVTAFVTKLSSVAEEADAAFTVALSSGVESVSTRVVPHNSVVRKALRVLVPQSIRDHPEVRDQVFSTVLVLAHHPFVVDGKTQSSFVSEWNHLKTHFLEKVPASEEDEEEVEETSDDRIDHLMEASETIRSSIISILSDAQTGLLYSSKAVERRAAQRVLATLLIFAGNGEGENIALHEIIEDRLMHRLDAEAIGSITDEDVAIFHTPFDQLYVPSALTEASESSVPSKRKSGSNRRGNEDEQWEQQVREELEKKKKAHQQKTVSLTPEEKAKLAEQQTLRLKLQATCTVVDQTLEAIDLLVCVQPEEMHAALPYLLRSLRVLFRTRLFAQHQATNAIRSIARAIAPDFLRTAHAEDVANALRIVLEAEQLESQAAQRKHLQQNEPLLQRTLEGLMRHVFGLESFEDEAEYDAEAPCNRLAPPTFHLVFPVLRMWLALGDPSMRLTMCLPLFAIHARMIPEEEEEEIGEAAAQHLLRQDMVELALTLTAQQASGDTIPINNPDLSPSHLVANLSMGVKLNDMNEWTAFFGDHGLLSDASEVRLACLKAMLFAAEADEEEEFHINLDSLMVCRLFCARFDAQDANRTVADHLWAITQSEITPLFAGPMLVYLNHLHGNVREAGALAIAAGMKLYPETTTAIVNNLKTAFTAHLPKPVELLDEFGIPKVRRDPQVELQEEETTYLPRCGVAMCLEKCATGGGASFGAKTNVVDVLSFVIEHGLGDSNSHVRAQMRKAGMAIVDTCGGGDNTAALSTMFERLLDKKPAQDPKEIAKYDHQREGVVVFLGSLAKHMDKSDPKVASIVDSLLDALNIPSESVQKSIAICLAPLVAAVKDKSTDILNDLLTRATSGETFGERIGAAYGVSAVVKGLGISALKQHDIIPRLEESMKTGGANARQGAMLVFECLSERLGMLFEPYIIVILPILLKCFADSSTQVRDAASQTAKKIMASLSAHGVKLVLPSLLRALEDNAWRTKQAGIQILGSMAYCAPRQLGSCLPQVVPKLTEALTDSHPRVREAGKSALRDIGSVVRNPEIASISNALLNALEDPNKHTAEALQKLQSTSFVHSIDAPSLALVMPIITRGLKDRGGDAKKKAALIVGSMCTMINDAKDLVPYMEMVLPSLKTQLMDPIPEVRAISAKAMGKLVKGLGEKHFSDILTWLLEAIKGDYGSVERSGAAQGLCEVLVALGKDRVESTLLDEIFPLSRHPKFSVREGVLWIIAFLPPALGKGFAVFIQDALPIVVAGLSDEAESVRDVAMHAGHVVVNAHALTHTKEILPSLEAGLFDDSWRIRQSSVQLLGDLMYRISGTRAVGLSEVTTGDIDEDDDAAGSAAGDRAIIKTLGMERRNAILASLYMIRSDTSAVVRQSSLQVWKSVVANTPKTLRQILEALMTAIVSALSGDNLEKQTMAGRTLGELVRKLGENVLPEIVPILRAGLAPSNNAGMRQGVCIGLAEVIDCCTKKQLEDYVDTLVAAILDGLCDDLPEVRSSAAQAFDVLQKSIGYRAVDETVPSLLHRIKSSSSAVVTDAQERALQGLQEILRVKSKEVLPYLIPRVLTTPLTYASVRCVSRAAQATGATIHFQVERIFAALITEYVELLPVNPSLAEAIQAALRDVVLAVEDAGVHWLVVEICKYCESEVVQQRALAFYLIGEFCAHTKTSYNDQTAMMLKQIVLHLNDTDSDVVQRASDALKGMNVTMRPEQMANHLDFIRQSINSMISDARHRKGGVGSEGEYLLPGLCISKGLEPFLPSYQFALMNGSPELRQSAAAGLGELVLLTSAASLRPYLIKLTGPLIRIAGDRFPGHVKAAILHTLEILLSKGGVALKPFLPQLQTTFVKALNDTAGEVRSHGASALSKLVTLSPRVDPLIAELTEKLKSTVGGIREANLDALHSVVNAVGEKLSEAVRAALEQALVELLEASDETVRSMAAKCLAAVVVTDADAGQAHAVQYGLAKTVDIAALSSGRRHSAGVFLEVVFARQPSWISEVAGSFTSVLTALAVDDQVVVRTSAIKAIYGLVKYDTTAIDAFIPVLAQNIQHPNKDVVKGALKITKRLAKRNPDAMRAHTQTLVPPTFGMIKSNNIASKIAAERALVYLLEIHTRPETLATYVRTATDANTTKIIAEYARRVLMKLKADSGDESD